MKNKLRIQALILSCFMGCVISIQAQQPASIDTTRLTRQKDVIDMLKKLFFLILLNAYFHKLMKETNRPYHCSGNTSLISKHGKMEIGQKFNTLTVSEYFFYIDNYKQYSDFNTLGLYRSIIENEKLDVAEKIEVREYAHKTFQKTFDFLQLKDPKVFLEVLTLGQTLTAGDEQQLWKNIKKEQQRILADKKIKHRNFGTYSKHNCPIAWCNYNGLMIRQGSYLTEENMHFAGDKNKYQAKVKSDRRKADRKKKKQIIDRELDNQNTTENITE